MQHLLSSDSIEEALKRLRTPFEYLLLMTSQQDKGLLSKLYKIILNEVFAVTHFISKAAEFGLQGPNHRTFVTINGGLHFLLELRL